jgi:hypothetical protein
MAGHLLGLLSCKALARSDAVQGTDRERTELEYVIDKPTLGLYAKVRKPEQAKAA